MKPNFALYHHPSMFPDGFNQQFIELTFDADEGTMRQDFMFWKQNMKNYHGFVGCLYVGSLVVGWSFCIQTSQTMGEYSLYTFVREEFRRRGFGRQLIDGMAKNLPPHRVYNEITVFGWDRASRTFYRNVCPLYENVNFEVMCYDQ